MRRPRLLQAAMADSVRTGTFHDVEIHVYSKREIASDYTHAPAIIHARASFLEEASSALRGEIISSFYHNAKYYSYTYTRFRSLEGSTIT